MSRFAEGGSLPRLGVGVAFCDRSLYVMGLSHSFRSWLDHKFKNDVYELYGGEIVRGRGSRPENRLRVADVKAWQIHPEMGFDVVEITLADGRQVLWVDKYNDLTEILQRTVWDAAAEQKRWRAALERGRKVQDWLGDASKPLSDFIVLCLAEMDAGERLSQLDCFSSRAAFLAEVRKLIVEPTAPSHPVPSIEVYRDAQKQWLEFIIRRFEHDA
jgi:hypothetical protein